VRKADQQLLPYVHAFQEGFWESILRTDPQAREWLFSVGWEFYGKAQPGLNGMPAAQSWGQAGQPAKGDADEHIDDDVASDLETLQSLMSAPADLADLPEPPEQKDQSRPKRSSVS
jgi:hypothetical protein